MTIKFKTIRPKLIDPRKFRDGIVEAAQEMAKGVADDFRTATSSWKNKPEFSQEVVDGTDEVTVIVLTDNQIFKYVSEGTVPHIIKPVKAKMLHWVNESGEDIFAKEVHHPGFAGRHIVEAIVESWRDKAPDLFNDVLAVVVKESGHAV